MKIDTQKKLLGTVFLSLIFMSAPTTAWQTISHYTKFVKNDNYNGHHHYWYGSNSQANVWQRKNRTEMYSYVRNLANPLKISILNNEKDAHRTL